MAAAGHTLLTRLRGMSKTPKRLAKMSSARREVMKQWREQPADCERLLRHRGTIERAFAAMSSFGGGLTHLPPWVRRLKRVRLWVLAKLAIYHARINARHATA